VFAVRIYDELSLEMVIFINIFLYQKSEVLSWLMLSLFLNVLLQCP